MKIIADALVSLPFKLHFCAEGPEVDPLTCEIDGFAATLYFPPSLGEGTDGKGLFGEWAWWTGTSLRVVLEFMGDPRDENDVARLKERAKHAGETLLRRFLNSCRIHLDQPEIYPVRIDPAVLTLHELHDDGSMTILEGPDTGFFFENMPDEPPLASSINKTTLELMRDDIESGTEYSHSDMLRLDARRLREQGEPDRAALLEMIALELAGSQ